VNGVNPGLILPPPGKEMDYLEKMDSTVPRKKHGSPKDIADAALYLLKSDFLIGEVINVDGGRHLMEYDRGPHPD
jgi:NAD(P)-dependent dehydrogenase (short-subunit alcohol dehydrogenase family)